MVVRTSSLMIRVGSNNVEVTNKFSVSASAPTYNTKIKIVLM
jgi:hypothetical protein